jgi:nicotinamidase-related amidase
MPSLFVDTPLDLRLKARGITTVVLAGVATDIGIEFTARHALASGYYSVIAEDATGAYTQEAHERSMAFLRNWGPVVSADEICSIWSPRQK